MRFKRILALFFIIVLIVGNDCSYNYANAQTGKAVKTVTKKVVKKTVKRNPKELAKFAISHGDDLLANQVFRKSMRAQLKKTFEREGVKTILEFSKKKSKNMIVSPSQLRTTKAVVAKRYSSVYKQSLKSGSKAIKLSYAGKVCLKSGTKEFLLPKGKEAIKVVWDPVKRKPVPLVKNLASDGSDVSKKYNEILLRERRKAISPYHQFLTLEQIGNYDKSGLILGQKASGDILRKNMYKAMPSQNKNIHWGFGGAAAHHVVEGGDKYADQSRKILEKFKIDINAPENGIFLPTDVNIIFKGAVHKTGHQRAYSEYVYSKLKDAKNEKNCYEILNTIKHELYEGKLSLEGPKQLINSNKI